MSEARKVQCERCGRWRMARRFVRYGHDSMGDYREVYFKPGCRCRRRSK